MALVEELAARHHALGQHRAVAEVGVVVAVLGHEGQALRLGDRDRRGAGQQLELQGDRRVLLVEVHREAAGKGRHDLVRVVAVPDADRSVVQAALHVRGDVVGRRLVEHVAVGRGEAEHLDPGLGPGRRVLQVLGRQLLREGEAVPGRVDVLQRVERVGDALGRGTRGLDAQILGAGAEQRAQVGTERRRGGVIDRRSRPGGAGAEDEAAAVEGAGGIGGHQLQLGLDGSSHGVQVGRAGQVNGGDFLDCAAVDVDLEGAVVDGLPRGDGLLVIDGAEQLARDGRIEPTADGQLGRARSLAEEDLRGLVLFVGGVEVGGDRVHVGIEADAVADREAGALADDQQQTESLALRESRARQDADLDYLGDGDGHGAVTSMEVDEDSVETVIGNVP